MRSLSRLLRAVPLVTLVACGGGDAPDLPEPGCDGVIGSSGDCVPYECGNGVLEPGEVCDDGNGLDGDGCDHFCQPHPAELWRYPSEGIVALAATSDGVVVGHYLFPEDVAAGKPLLEWLDQAGHPVASVQASGFAEGVIEPQRIVVGEGGFVALVGGWRPSQSELASQGFVLAARPGQVLWTTLAFPWREDVGLVWGSASIHPDGVAVAGTEVAYIGTFPYSAPTLVTALYDGVDGHERWYKGAIVPELSSPAASGVLAHADGSISAGGHGDGFPLVVHWAADGTQLAATTTPALDWQEILQLGTDRAGHTWATLGYWDGSTSAKTVAAVGDDGTLTDVQPVASFGYPEFTSDGRVLCTELDEQEYESRLVIVDPLEHTRVVHPLGMPIGRVSVLGSRLYLATSDLYGGHLRAVDLTRAP